MLGEIEKPRKESVDEFDETEKLFFVRMRVEGRKGRFRENRKIWKQTKGG